MNLIKIKNINIYFIGRLKKIYDMDKIYLSSNIYIFIVIIALTVVVSCDDTRENIYDYKFPEEGEVSFQNHVQPFMKLRCSSNQCHGDYSQSTSRRITDYLSYFSGMNAGSLVILSDTESSLLLQVLDGRNPHLSNLQLVAARENQIDGVRRWIEDGAPNN